MAKKKTTKAPAKKAAAKGVKPGTKRGPYTKTLKEEKNEEPAHSNADEQKQPKSTFEQAIEETAKASTNNTGNDSDNSNSDTSDLTDDSKAFSEFQAVNGAKEEYKAPTEEEAAQAKKEAVEEVDADGYKTVKREFKERTKRLITGRTLLNFCDAVFPGLLLTVYGVINKEIKSSGIKARELRLTKEQREDLMELADDVAQVIFEGADPLTMFFILLAVNYYGNLQVALIDKQEYLKQAA